MFGLRLGVRFADTWRPQLEAIRAFLVRQGLRMGSVGADKNRAGNRRTAYRLDIHETRSVLELLGAIELFCVKKRADIRIALDYLEDRATAYETVDSYNEQVRIGRRRGIVRAPRFPYKKSEGHRICELTNARKAREAHMVRLGPEVESEIRDDHRIGLSYVKLARKYGHSKSVISRILHGS